MAEGILFSVGDEISITFNGCRIGEHCKNNKKHKEAKTLAVSKKLSFQSGTGLLSQTKDSDIADYDQLFLLMEFIQITLKKDLSISAIVEIVKYCSNKGLNIPKHYTCFSSMREIILLMAKEYQETLVAKIKASQFFSIALDGSTDVSKTKSICINVCYMENLEPQWSYLDSLFLKTFDAKTITDSLIALFEKLGLDWQSKLVGYCSDGEATVRSDQNGVYGLLKRRKRTLVGIHCLAHSFSLTHKSDLSDKYPILGELFQLAYGTYKYLNNSPKRLDELFAMQSDIQELIDQLNLVKPIKIRWLSLFNSITRIVRIFKPLIQTLEKHKGDITVRGLLSIYSDPRSLSWLHFLSDLSNDVKMVTEIFQEKHFHIKKAVDLINSVKTNLKRKYINEFKPGYNYS